MRRDRKTVIEAGTYKHALRLEKLSHHTNQLGEQEQVWTPQTVVMGSVEPFGGYEGMSQHARRDTELANVFTRALPDYPDMSSSLYRWVWQVQEDSAGVSVPALEKVLAIQTYRDVLGRERKWAFVCMVSIQRESS